MTTRKELIAEARNYLGAKFGHQGRRKDMLDCGGLVMMAARGVGISSLEFLSYANFPTDGKFEELLDEHAIDAKFSSKFPHNFGGEEFAPGDLLAFDYGSGEGVRHIAFVTKWDGKRYWIIDAQPDFGVSEHPLAFPFTKHGTTVHKYLIKNLDEDAD